MSASSKAPKGLKDSKCKKRNLGVRLPIPYVPPINLLQTKESSDNIKLKLPNGTVFTMSIFAKGNPEDNLLHVQAVLRLINQKGLDEQCKKLQKELREHTASPGVLKQKSIGPKGSNSKKDLDDVKDKLALTQEMFNQTQKQYNETVASMYELLRNLLASKPQTL
jgi:hypothetical protein